MSTSDPNLQNDAPQTDAVPESENAPAQTDSTPGTQHSALNPIEQIQANDLQARIIEVLRTVYDPEIPVNIYEMGLIYKIDTDPEGRVNIEMTLTSPMCPVAGSLPPEVEMKVQAVQGVTDCKVNVVWDPPWTPDKMSEAAKLTLGMM
jgi:FeS assembly SUF system protein